MNRVLASFLFLAVFMFIDSTYGVDRRLQNVNIDFINIESNNRKVQQPTTKSPVLPKTGPAAPPSAPATPPKSASPTPSTVPKSPTNINPQQPIVTTTPGSLVKQLAKNYDDRVSQIAKEVSKQNRTAYPALPNTSGTAPTFNPGQRSWASVVASEKPKNPSTKS